MEISLRMWLLGIEQHSRQIKLFKRKQNDCEVKRCSKFCGGEVLRLSLNVKLTKMYSIDSLSGGHIFINSCACEVGLYGHRGLQQARLLTWESGLPFTALYVRFFVDTVVLGQVQLNVLPAINTRYVPCSLICHPRCGNLPLQAYSQITSGIRKSIFVYVIFVCGVSQFCVVSIPRRTILFKRFWVMQL